MLSAFPLQLVSVGSQPPRSSRRKSNFATVNREALCAFHCRYRLAVIEAGAARRLQREDGSRTERGGPVHHTRSRATRNGSAHQLSRPPRHVEIHQQTLGRNAHRALPIMSGLSKGEIHGRLLGLIPSLLGHRNGPQRPKDSRVRPWLATRLGFRRLVPLPNSCSAAKNMGYSITSLASASSLG